MPETDFGYCCENLHKSLTIPREKFFHVSDLGVLFLTVGAFPYDGGTKWFNCAVLFCPFCGRQLQTAEEIKSKSDAAQQDYPVDESPKPM